MGLRDKLEGVKKKVETKNLEENLTSGRGEIGQLSQEEKTLSEEVNKIKELVKKLESSYIEAHQNLSDFAEAKNRIHNLFNEYSDYLKQQGIQSPDQMLNNSEFIEEDEVKQYRSKGGKGKLGEGVAKVGNIKEELKEALPKDMELDFRGGKESEEKSPRQKSLAKIHQYIDSLEDKLLKIKEVRAGKQSEYLPKIKELIAEQVDKTLKSPNFSVHQSTGDVVFIPDEVFKFCGDELWSVVQTAATEMITKKFNERDSANQARSSSHFFTEGNIYESLTTEKLIYDINRLKQENPEILKKEQDRENIENLGHKVSQTFYASNFGKEAESVFFKDRQFFSSPLHRTAEKLTESDREFKETYERMKNKFIFNLEEYKKKISTGLLAGRQNRINSNTLSEVIEKVRALDVPSNPYSSKETYLFFNALGRLEPNFSNDKDNESFASAVKGLFNGVKEALDKKGREIDRNLGYHFKEDLPRNSHGHNGVEIVKVGDFDIPAINLESQESYKNLNNKDFLEEFWARLDGKDFSSQEIKAEFKKEADRLEAEIKSDPGAEEVLNKFRALKDKIIKEYTGEKMALLNRKLAAKKDKKIHSDNEIYSYQPKNDLINFKS